jgi:hypothetical protein
MFLKQKKLKNFEHALNGSICDCQPIKFTYQQNKIIPEFCFKHNHTHTPDYIITTPDTELHFQENTNHTYFYSAKQDCHLLTTPKPFRISVDWPTLIYNPALSHTSNTEKTTLYFTLVEPQLYKDNITPYTTTPDRWEAETHPFFSEPADTDELSLYSKHLYGAETLSRVLTMNHPCKSKHIPVYSATSKQFVTPILSMTTKFTLDDFLTTVFAPFCEHGHGTILCSVCITSPTTITEPCFLTRTQYKAHFRKHHFNNTIFMGLGFASRYHTRMYEAFNIYTRINFIAEDTTDHPDKHPFHPESKKLFTATTTSLLTKIFKVPDTPTPMQSATTHLETLALTPPQTTKKNTRHSTPPRTIPGLPPQQTSQKNSQHK